MPIFASHMVLYENNKRTRLSLAFWSQVFKVNEDLERKKERKKRKEEETKNKEGGRRERVIEKRKRRKIADVCIAHRFVREQQTDQAVVGVLVPCIKSQ